MARVGLNARTGQLLTGWPHCVQSIGKILSTEIGERVQRRDFGSNLLDLLDRPQNQETLVSWYVAVSEALEPRNVDGHELGEPGWVTLVCDLDPSVPGEVKLTLGGVFFENGHLGDYSTPSQREIVYSLTPQLSGSVSFEAVT